MFQSAISPNEPVYDDGTTLGHVMDERPDTNYETGLELPSGHVTGEGYEGVAEPFPSNLIIPRGEWQARIEEREALNLQWSQKARALNIPCKNQGNIPYCWIFAPTHCNELVHAVVQNGPYVSLSPASAGAPIKNFRAEGGWGKEGLQWISDKGQNRSIDWPDTAIQRSLYTDENKAKATFNRVTEWWVCKTWDEVFSSLFLFPGASGLNWWRHEVTYYDPIWKDGAEAIRFRNSWGMSYGDLGFGIVQGSKMKPDDYVVPRVTMAHV